VDAEEARTIGARARTIRRRRGLSLDVASGLAGISKPYLSALERGQRGFNRQSGSSFPQVAKTADQSGDSDTGASTGGGTASRPVQLVLDLRSSRSTPRAVSTTSAPERPRRPGPFRVLDQSNRPARTLAVNADHCAAVKVRAGPVGFLLSRTARPPPSRSATSTQLAMALVKVDFRHRAGVGSRVICVAPSKAVLWVFGELRDHVQALVRTESLTAQLAEQRI
jgi:transcriptional regulator with XRE-family HTH domain